MNYSTRMTKEKKVRKWAVQLNENKVTQKKKSLSARRKRVCGSLQYRKKTSVRQKARQDNTEKLRKAPKKLAVSNVLAKHNKEIYDRQIKQLNLVLKRSLSCPTLTPDELKMLFLKYQLDGHYRPTKNLPLVASLANGTSGTTNGRQFYDAAPRTSVPDVQVTNYKSSDEAAGNSYRDIAGENRRNEENAYRNMQINSKQDTWKPKAALEESNADNEVDNKYPYVRQSPAIGSNYNRMLASYDARTCNSASMFDDAQNFDQSKANLDVNRISDMAGEHFSYDLMNAQSIPSEDQSYGYASESLLCNLPSASLEYENANSGSDISQQNDPQCPMQYNDLWNQNLCADFHSSNWNSNVSLLNNSNVQSWQSEPMRTYTSNLESYYHKNHSVGQSDFDSNVNMYHSMDSDIVPYVANSGVNGQQDISGYYAPTSTVPSNNFLTDASAFISSYANTSDQCM